MLDRFIRVYLGPVILGAVGILLLWLSHPSARVIGALALVALALAALWLVVAPLLRRREEPPSRLNEMTAQLQMFIVERQSIALQRGELTPQQAMRFLQTMRGLSPVPAPVAEVERGGTLRRLTEFPGAGSLAHLGYRIFKWLLALAALLLLGLMIYAWMTYPRAGEAAPLLSGAATEADRISALENLRSSWLQQTKDLGQMFILTPLFPLIGAVIGYLFGVRRSQSAGDENPATQTPPAKGPAAPSTPDNT